MRKARFRYFFPALLLAALAGCGHPASNPSDQDREIREQSARAAAEARQRAEEAERVARGAAANAERKLNDVASGVREGLNQPAGGEDTGRIDINSATVETLARLPGIPTSRAEQIVRGRPYNSTHDLVARGILSERAYERISSRITAR